LELLISHREDLIENDYFGIEMDRDGEPESTQHSARVGSNRFIDKFLNLAELDD